MLRLALRLRPSSLPTCVAHVHADPQPWWRSGHAFVGQVLAGNVERLRLGGPEPAAARNVAAALQRMDRHRPCAPRSLLVPLPHGVFSAQHVFVPSTTSSATQVSRTALGSASCMQLASCLPPAHGRKSDELSAQDWMWPYCMCCTAVRREPIMPHVRTTCWYCFVPVLDTCCSGTCCILQHCCTPVTHCVTQTPQSFTYSYAAAIVMPSLACQCGMCTCRYICPCASSMGGGARSERRH